MILRCCLVILISLVALTQNQRQGVIPLQREIAESEKQISVLLKRAQRLLSYELTASEIDNHAVQITASPQKIYIEKSTAGQFINFDFLIQNLTDEQLTINQIEVSVLDASDKLILRKSVSNNGSRSSIATISSRTLPANKITLLFNPLYFFDHSIELQKLRYEFTINSKKANKDYTEVITVSPVFYETKTDLALPVQGRLIVWDGHDYYSHHRRTDPILYRLGYTTNFQRYGYDLVPINEQGEMYRGDPKRNEDWFGFGSPISATANGKVAMIFDGMPDNRSFNESEIGKREMAIGGNYIVIDHLNGEFSYFGHLKQGSIKVKIGETVKQGQVMAQMGASGSSLFPHLHYELRTGPGERDVEGLPSYFSRYRRWLGSRSVNVKRGLIDTGAIVERQ